MSFLELNNTPITGKRLRKIREALPKLPHEMSGNPRYNHHPSQAQMAERVGVPKSAWSAWETSGVDGPAAVTVHMWLSDKEPFDPDASVLGEEVRHLVEFIAEVEAIGPTKAKATLADEMGVTQVRMKLEQMADELEKQ